MRDAGMKGGMGTRRWLVLALGLAVTACSEAGDIMAPADEDPELAAAVEASTTFDAVNLDRGNPDGWDVLVAEIPGFAGFWFDRACNLNVLLVDLSQSDKAKDLLQPLLRRFLNAHRRCPDTATIVVHQATFSWVQLTGWLQKLRPLIDHRGVLRIGISIPANRIVVVLASRTLHPTVVAEIQRLDVPLDAIQFVVNPPTTDRTGRTGRTGG
ncbi:MAG: hypothetical protein L0271_08145 [Gemmatimonadetes bacterium]|nr:hypothetical protein [Gemmatimonadota bacterium]